MWKLVSFGATPNGITTTTVAAPMPPATTTTTTTTPSTTTPHPITTTTTTTTTIPTGIPGKPSSLLAYHSIQATPNTDDYCLLSPNSTARPLSVPLATTTLSPSTLLHMKNTIATTTTTTTGTTSAAITTTGALSYTNIPTTPTTSTTPAVTDLLLEPVPTRRFILYLEPGPDTDLYRSILSFYQRSREEFGPNEAHMVSSWGVFCCLISITMMTMVMMMIPRIMLPPRLPLALISTTHTAP